MSVTVSAEEIARAFATSATSIASNRGYDATEGWDEADPVDRSVIIDAMQAIIDDGTITSGEALRTYGRHFDECEFLGRSTVAVMRCTCGFGEVCK